VAAAGRGSARSLKIAALYLVSLLLVRVYVALTRDCCLLSAEAGGGGVDVGCYIRSRWTEQEDRRQDGNVRTLSLRGM
jgi:hypothetical protein